MIEIKVINTGYQNKLALAIDGAIYEHSRILISESGAELQTDSVGGDSFFEVTILDHEIADMVMVHRFSDISKEIMRIVLHPSLKLIEGETAIAQGIAIRRGFVGVRGGYIGETYIVFNFYFDPDNWKQLWSIREYQKEFRRIFERQNLPDIKWKPEEARIDGIGSIEDRIALRFSVQDNTTTIEAEAFKHSKVLKYLHELTESSLEPQLRNPDTEQIIRSIEFPPEYYHSGITILSYFTAVLRHKNLSEQVKVSIQQSGLKVRLIIESPSGQRELIERALETYALVVTGNRPIEELTTDPYEVMELKCQLRIAHAQLQNQRDMLALKSSEVGDTKVSLKRLEQRSDEDRARFMALIERLTSHNAELATGFKELAEQAAQAQNKALAGALENLYKVVERGAREEDREEVIQSLTTIHREDTGVFQRVYDTLLMGAVSEGAGNYLYSWLQFFVGTLPK
jgi:hypothetical protein